MKKLRKEDISLHHFIRNRVLGDFIETEKSISLAYMPDVSSESGSAVYQINTSMNPNPFSFGRGLAYIDSYDYYTEQSGSVVVYNNVGSIIDNVNYEIDYIDGRIIFANTSYNPSIVDYRWYYVSIVDEWEHIQSADVPVVVIDIASFNKEGFQLGGGKKIPRRVNLHIFSSSQSEREDLTEALYDGLYLKQCPLQGLSHGTMLDWDGRWNVNYIFSTISGSSYLNFDNIRARNIYPRLMMIPSSDMTQLSDLNRYRSRISFDMFHWEEA
jgi:hypothetical protein